MTDEVTRFKMYKAGKKWVIAGITKCKFIIFSKKDEANVKVNQKTNDVQYQKVYDDGDTGAGNKWKLLSGLAAGLGLGAISQVDNKVNAVKQPANEKKVDANALAQKDSVAISLNQSTNGSQNNSTSIKGTDQSSETMKSEQAIGINPTRIDIGGEGGNYTSVGMAGGDVKIGYVNADTKFGTIFDSSQKAIGKIDVAVTQTGKVYIYLKTTVTTDISFGFGYFDSMLGADLSSVKEYIPPVTITAGQDVYVYLSKEQLAILYQHINPHDSVHRDGLGYVAAMIDGKVNGNGDITNPAASGISALWNKFISSLSSSESASESASASKEKSESESASKEKSESESASKEKSESESASKTKSESESASKEKSESESASKEKSESESASKTKSESESASKTKSESESASKTKSESESASKAKSESESASKEKSESESASRERLQSETPIESTVADPVVEHRSETLLPQTGSDDNSAAQSVGIGLLGLTAAAAAYRRKRKKDESTE